MTPGDVQLALKTELEATIKRFIHEFHITYCQIVGVLMFLVADMIEVSGDGEEDDED